MLEYYLSYEDLYEILNGNIDERDVNIKNHKAEILTALTINIDEKNNRNMAETIALWDSQLQGSTELLLKTRYIRMSEIALDFLKVMLMSGFADFIVASIVGGGIELGMLSISLSTNVVCGIHELMKKVCQLDNWDFCVYRQAVSHFRTHQQFSKSELEGWFEDNKGKCNMHNSTWNCEHLNDNDSCVMLMDKRLENALESLEKKGALKKVKKDGETIFTFKR